MFAKLYEFDDLGQVLVQKTTDDDGAPCVKFTASFGGVEVSLSPTFKDSTEGYKSREEAFSAVTEETARGAGEDIQKQAAAFLPATEG